MKHSTWLWAFTLITVILFTYALPVKGAPPPSQNIALSPDYWPTYGWRASTPEEQGMSSAKLLEMEQQIALLPWGSHVKSVLIIRNGYIVHESYYDPAYGVNQIVNIYSCTKSVSSALIGIAIEEGHIGGVNETMVDLFENRTIANLDSRKQAVILQYLLTMQSGIDWDEWPYGPTSSFTYMVDSPDWVQYVLDRPMRDDPGTVWDYNSGGSHLLSQILNQTVGNSTRTFAEDRLFTPLGITNYQWDEDPQGVVFGAAWLHLRPRDMAKFGFLYLNNGTWDGDQLIPATWVNESTSLFGYPYSESEPYGYGYQWWLNLEINGYLAIGYNGQQINVVPEHNLVVVFTANSEDATFAAIMRDYVVASIEYETPTPVPFPFTFEQILLIGQVLMVVAFIAPFIGLIIHEMWIRKKRRQEKTSTT